MPETFGTYLVSPSAPSDEVSELTDVIAELNQKINKLTDRVDRLDPEVANQRFLEEQQEALAAQSRRVAAEAQSYEQSRMRDEARRIAQDFDARTLPLANARSISRLYETNQLTRGTHGEQELIQELKRLGWSD